HGRILADKVVVPQGIGLHQHFRQGQFGTGGGDVAAVDKAEQLYQYRTIGMGGLDGVDVDVRVEIAASTCKVRDLHRSSSRPFRMYRMTSSAVPCTFRPDPIRSTSLTRGLAPGVAATTCTSTVPSSGPSGLRSS